MRNFQTKQITVQKACTIMLVYSRQKEKEAKTKKQRLKNPTQTIEEPNIQEKINWNNEKKISTAEKQYSWKSKQGIEELG